MPLENGHYYIFCVIVIRVNDKRTPLYTALQTPSVLCHSFYQIEPIVPVRASERLCVSCEGGSFETDFLLLKPAHIKSRRPGLDWVLYAYLGVIASFHF